VDWYGRCSLLSESRSITLNEGDAGLSIAPVLSGTILSGLGIASDGCESHGLEVIDQ